MSSRNNILVIDNQASTLSFLANLLKKEGYEVQRADTGELGLSLAFTTLPDLVLVDAFIADINGYEICNRIKADASIKDTPVIFMSFLDDARQKVKAFQCGAVDYIMKPFQPEEVLARISHQITIQKLQQQLKFQNQSLEKEVAIRSITETALKESERKYRVLVDSSQDVIWTTDNEGIYTYVNLAVEKFYGYIPEEMIGRSWRDIVAPTAPDREFVVVDSIRKKDNLTPWESLHQGKDGRKVAVLVKAVALLDDQGSIIGATGTYTDITLRKQAEEATKLLLATTQAISRAEDVDAALREILRLICQAIGWEVGEAWMPAEGTSRSANPAAAILEYRADWYRNPDNLESFHEISRKTTFTFGSAVPGTVWATQKPVWIEDFVADTQRIFQHSEAATACGLRSLFAVPIIHGEQVLAVLTFLRRTPSPEDHYLLDLVGAVASQMGIMISQKIAEESLRRSEAELRALFATMQDVVLVRDRTGRCTKIAPTNPVNLFKSADHMLGTTLHDVLPKSEADKILETIQKVLESGKTTKIEYGFLIQDRQVWFDNIISPLDKDLVMLVGRDVSDQKQSESMLLETVERDRALTSAIQRIRQSLDIDTIFRATVQELRQVIKCDRVLIYRFQPDWSGEYVAESVSPEWLSLAPEEDITKNALEQDDCVTSKMRSQAQDTYLQDTEGGGYSQGVHVAVEDIYERGFSKCYLDLLEKLEARAYLIIPIFLGDRLWGLLGSYQNSAPRNWKRQEINTVTQISLQLGVALQQAELLKQTQQQTIELRQAVVAADTANRAKSEFLANMSHELRTPLNAILGFTQIMNRDVAIKSPSGQALSAEYQQYLKIISRAGSHLLDLINDVLEMSKIEAGKTTLNPSAFNLKEMLTNLEAMFCLKAEHKNLGLFFHPESNLPEFIVTDESKLRQILINLLANAIKFTDQGQVSLEVHHEYSLALGNSLAADQASSELPRLRLFFSITDTGPGITPEEMPLLFKVFRQTATGHKSKQGTGLGLPISQQYAQMLGGKIEVNSSPQGSCFSFAIEAAIAEAFPENAALPQGEILGLLPGQEPCRILVVDDSPENRLLVRNILSKIGFGVAEAENGLQAAGLWQAWKPHLVLMDIRMPVLDGYGGARLIRDLEEQEPFSKTPQKSIEEEQGAGGISLRKANANEERRPTVIIALTASAFQEQEQYIIAAGCDDIIIKPLQTEILLSKIAQYLKVEYIYQQASVEVNNLIPKVKGRNLGDLQSLLRQSSPEWVAQVQQAAAQGSDDLIFYLVEQLPPEQEELAIVIGDLARNFQFEKILEIIHQD